MGRLYISDVREEWFISMPRLTSLEKSLAFAFLARKKGLYYLAGPGPTPHAAHGLARPAKTSQSRAAMQEH
jgi:hypothetical protein